MSAGKECRHEAITVRRREDHRGAEGDCHAWNLAARLRTLRDHAAQLQARAEAESHPRLRTRLRALAGARSKNGGSNAIGNGRIRVWVTSHRRSSRQRIRGTRRSRVTLGQQTRSWPARCNALRPRIRSLTVFCPPSDHEGRAEKLGRENGLKQQSTLSYERDNERESHAWRSTGAAAPRGCPSVERLSCPKILDQGRHCKVTAFIPAVNEPSASAVMCTTKRALRPESPLSDSKLST